MKNKVGLSIFKNVFDITLLPITSKRSMSQPQRRLCMEERFVIKRKDFKKLERYAENIYNTIVVIDYFCSSQKEYEELYNLSPIVKNLRRDADQVNAFFINYPENIDE